MKRIWIFVRQDLLNSIRDNIGLYMVLAPLIMAIGFRLFLPSVQEAAITFAVDNRAEAVVMNAFSAHGRVETIDTETNLIQRVGKSDDVVGIVFEGEGQYRIVIEGNEHGNLHLLAAAILDRTFDSNTEWTINRISLEQDPQQIREITTSMLVLGIILIAGILITFNMIEEKESKTIQAMAVSPLSLKEYIAARGIIIFIIGIGLIMATTAIMLGIQQDWLRVLIGSVASIGLGILLGLTMGGLTDSQVSAIAAVKLLMIFMTGIPLGSLFAPVRYTFLFYPFPNYWVFQIFQNVFLQTSYGLGYWRSCLFAVLTTTVFMLILLPVLRKKIRLR